MLNMDLHVKFMSTIVVHPMIDDNQIVFTITIWIIEHTCQFLVVSATIYYD
jgi:hypothetical protein